MSVFRIENPCHEEWENMKIGVDSRFCNHCTKNVIDFTGRTRDEILEYILVNYNKNICGRFYSRQLDFNLSDFIITIQAVSKNRQNNNLSFYLLTLGTLIFSVLDNEATAQVNSPALNNNQSEISSVPSDRGDSLKAVLKCSKPKSLEENIIEEQEVIFGMIKTELDSNLRCIGPYTHAEIMPEFNGGMEGLMNYLQENIHYPLWERKNRIEGIIYVSFVVDKNGKIKDAKILKSVNGSQNFDKEVLRVIANMPDWKPGITGGENVDVIFNLPFIFKL
ncbi:MAG: energy transducer TonB [Sporocytophaga sp.]|uniref:energy transducer TonB n=1 Tax=Sporocytophaga sp. TaxID=2231183 RepID=UPI001B0ED170|nr:energy transducer TonB [Sporocytophaga sp.]MBO9702992.1 energy transducer TonB [Sporocytophaga sp.]